MDLKKHIRSIPDYPKKGILFRDITTLIKDAKAFKYTNDRIIEIAKKIDFDKVAAIESRGFVFASTVSYQLEKPFILLRKKNLCRHYSIANKNSYSILNVAKMFDTKIKFLPKRAGERYASAIINKNLSNKMYTHFGHINLKDYIKEFIRNN